MCRLHPVPLIVLSVVTENDQSTETAIPIFAGEIGGGEANAKARFTLEALAYCLYEPPSPVLPRKSDCVLQTCKGRERSIRK